MNDAELPTPEPEAGPAKDDAVFVVTSPFGERVVGDEVSADEAADAPYHAVVRRAAPKVEGPAPAVEPAAPEAHD